MQPRRLRLVTLLAGIVLSGLTLLAWTQTWYTLSVTGSVSPHGTLVVDGGVAAPALAALSLAGLSLVAALAIAGRVFRIVLGVLQVAIGVTVTLSAIISAVDPVGASAPAVTKVTGISGHTSVSHLVSSVSITAWPWIAIVLGGLTALLGILVLVTSRLWPTSSRRYQAVRLEEVDETSNPVSDWDGLSDGRDPTSR
jgi:uncharacterized membrane protein (TIGR02234 family)